VSECARCRGDGWVEAAGEVVRCPCQGPLKAVVVLPFSQYVARCLARGDFAEVARWEQRLGGTPPAVGPKGAQVPQQVPKAH